ncbi:MAG: hypothetical protein LBH02_00680 [Methanocalculaceae archaeon]|jgi:hypothetical protein|nr:hypothetical protein [Methanocalculaceae archaeon]
MELCYSVVSRARAKFHDYFARSGISVKFYAIEKLIIDAEVFLEISKDLCGHEIKVVAMINKMMEIRVVESSYAFVPNSSDSSSNILRVERNEVTKTSLTCLKNSISSELLLFVNHHLGSR